MGVHNREELFRMVSDKAHKDPALLGLTAAETNRIMAGGDFVSVGDCAL
jgi:hypothetical protein